MLRFLSRGLGGGAPIFVTRVRGGAPKFVTAKPGILTPPHHIIVEHSLRGGTFFRNNLGGGTFFRTQKGKNDARNRHAFLRRIV